jgi:hypothetical protein
LQIETQKGTVVENSNLNLEAMEPTLPEPGKERAEDALELVLSEAPQGFLNTFSALTGPFGSPEVVLAAGTVELYPASPTRCQRSPVGHPHTIRKER